MDIFSHEYEILTLLHEAGEASYKDLSCLLRPSSATLERRLGTLCYKGLIESVRETADRRRRKFTLTGEARKVLDEELAFFSDWPFHQSDAATAISRLVSNLQRRLGIRIFGQRYQLVLGLYRNDGARTSSLLSLAQISRGSFFDKLKVLKMSGIVGSARDSTDSRLVQVFLSDWVTRAIDDAHADLNKWALNARWDSPGRRAGIVDVSLKRGPKPTPF
ncbi:MarR family transcriptional regulator [Afipia felis]|uniref:MarR family transcriptional regulator n=1 Tax=Afipia felis TaxID=1035 RepID=UPI0009E2D014